MSGKSRTRRQLRIRHWRLQASFRETIPRNPGPKTCCTQVMGAVANSEVWTGLLKLRACSIARSARRLQLVSALSRLLVVPLARHIFETWMTLKAVHGRCAS